MAEPGVPIRFDAGLNEYHLVYDASTGQGRMILRYCPFCGGSAPKSVRSELFARITNAELKRVDALTRGLQTIEAVLSALGAPDEDLDHGDGTGITAATDELPTFEYCRTLVYRNLSETVVVRVNERGDGRVRFSFSGKQLHPKPNVVAP